MRIKKDIEFSFLAVVLSFLVGCSQSLDFTDTQGNSVDLRSDDNQWLVLNFWAEWCGPCRDEVPELNALSDDGKVRVVGVDYDDSQGEQLISKAEALGIRFPVLQESPLIALKASPPQVLPATYILSPEGKIVEKLIGPQTREVLEATIQQLSKAGANG
ncbi:TlpA family protein disulfide reductase [Endozoicomonas ascidiicola]|uniref:TlpA family protein disulfide reductase n=1 Tax=Endozoicomonas ascidiicola TaxID=1698521 RepID=UPI00083311F7|nr:TlpA disulfide reductase family protein [Endozoicomonas ascidiicola]